MPQILGESQVQRLAMNLKAMVRLASFIYVSEVIPTRSAQNKSRVTPLTMCTTKHRQHPATFREASGVGDESVILRRCLYAWLIAWGRDYLLKFRRHAQLGRHSHLIATKFTSLIKLNKWSH